MTKLSIPASLIILLFVVCACQKEITGTTDHSFIQMTTTKANDSLNYTRFFYDSQNRIVIISDSSNSGHKYIKGLTYDTQGRLAVVTDSFDGALNDSFSFLYDSKGRIVQKISNSSSGSGNSLQNTYAYDQKGRLIADTTYSSWSRMIYQYTTYRYDENNNIVERKTFDATGALEQTIQAQYDTKPNPYSHFGLVLYFTGNYYSLNQNNCLSESYPDGTKFSYEYQYNSMGLPIRFSVKDNTDPLIIYGNFLY
ncbi:hypothetical protein [Flavisolibacter nicotianae]|uniref:hypothetical protein n=1 Tax=Flavisolibacter nicotianae TaxID=2364882 RepID=UPI000EAFD915|nr:hypothetical protein [Flavisolibacter nicotianae]